MRILMSMRKLQEGETIATMHDLTVTFPGGQVQVGSFEVKWMNGTPTLCHVGSEDKAPIDDCVIRSSRYTV